jgi:hypothetical protein
LLDRYKLSCRGLEILADDARVLGRDSQEGQSWTLWGATSLFPIAESVDADTHGLSELGLRQANEAPERGNVFAGFEFALDEASTQARWDGRFEVSVGKFSDVIGGHVMSLR